ncbi:hypothetical protein Z951_45385 [Streptomyces sp. PRh5]|uniref:hypothetical protein n=1 Tax=Streptomyces sp. PRh5 TaxID=1158056 RepID=UPI000450D230|nr:hypothetical protein [Streptomyces sp. PRh5]EXU61765.1 hypothetical protein Z951_45385 [Streptomyces sp. PRh5]
MIRDSRAAHHIALLAQSCRVEPASALIFACLLHLAGQGGSAVWWQFSAGTGSVTAALCLYLMCSEESSAMPSTGHAKPPAWNLENQTSPSDGLVGILRRPSSHEHCGSWYTPSP